MWMMGCNESGGSFNMSDSLINGSSRKLRPLIPKPSSSTTSTTTSTTTSRNLHHHLQHHHHHHHTDFYLLNNHFSMVSEQNKRDLHLGGATTTTTVVSSRWNPTPEQLRTLEELYRRGTRTPSAEQIQHITAQLRRYGKIEGKNVFYWFQNHKARERQKRRRRSECIAEDKQHEIDPTNESADVAAGSSRTAYEVEQTKSCSHHHLTTNSTTLLTQEAVSMQEAAEAAAVVVVVGDGGGSDQSTSVKTDGWIQLEQRELQLTRRNNSTTTTTTTTHDDTNHATWHMRNPSFSSSSSPPLPNHLINTTTSTTTTPPTDPKLMNTDHQQDDENLMMNMFIIAPMKGNQDAHTLELFPLQKAVDREDSERVINGGDHFHQHYNTGKIKNGSVHDNHHHLLMPVTTMNNNTNFMNTQYPKFFEFL